MATLTIKKLPDEIYAKLKESASRHRRSMNSEAVVCLEKALTGRPVDDPEEFLAHIIARQERIGPIGMTNEEINKAKRWGRP